MAIDLYPGQQQALRRLSNGQILAGDVGTGKSIVALAYYYTKVCGGPLKIGDVGDNGPRARSVPLLIITTAKKRDSGDWERHCASFGLGADDFTVDSWNNITKYSTVNGYFVIFDEQRLVGSGSWVKTFYKIARNNKWLILSATPGDVWMDYVPVFVANRFFLNKTDFARQHVVYSNWGGFPKVERYVNEAPLEKYRDRLLVEIPIVRHTTRHVEMVTVDYDKERFETAWKKRWNPFKDQPIENIAELFRVAREIVNSDSSRTAAIASLLENHPRLIIFYNFNYELELLRGWISRNLPGVSHAEWNGHLHQEVPCTDSWLYLVQYTAGAEGWECTSTSAMVFYSLNYSYKVWHQAMGRIDRFNTPFKDLYYYVLRSNSPIDKAIYGAIRRKKNFNEKGFAKAQFGGL